MPIRRKAPQLAQEIFALNEKRREPIYLLNHLGFPEGHESLIPEGRIYIIQFYKWEVYKIGKSKDELEREGGLQTSCPFKLHIVAAFTVPGEHLSGIEKAIHRELNEYRTNGGREWFAISLEELSRAIPDVLSLYRKRHHLGVLTSDR